jgi:hypothetical protein
MNYKNIAHQAINFNRAAFDNTFNAMVIWQDQVERGLRALREQAAWLPTEGQAMMDEWVEACKSGRNEFRKAVEGSFDKATDLFA